MKSIKLTTLLFIAVLVLAGCSSDDGDYFDSDNTPPLAANDNVNTTVTSTFADLFATGGNAECTFMYEDNDFISSGTIWLQASAGNMAGDFTVTNPNAAEETFSMIMVDETRYVWGSTFPQGMKMGVIDGAVFEGIGEDSTDSNDDFGLSDDDEVEFDCDNWSVDASKFVPPSDIEFIDITDTINQLNEITNSINTNGGVPAIDCSVCNLIPDSAEQAECMAALGC